MDELGLFFKALPEKGLAEKSISAKGGKKCCTIAIFVAADGSKVTDPVVIGRSRKPNCFRNLKDISRPLNTHYFNNKKSWMNTEIMEVILTRLDRRLSGEGRKVLLFLGNATCHPHKLETKLENIELKFLPKCTSSRLQPCDAGIIRNLKYHYRKSLVRFVVSRIDSNKIASEIIEEVTILKAINWIPQAWRSVEGETIINCFKKCGFQTDLSSTPNPHQNDQEFEDLLNTLSTEDLDIDEFIDFGDQVDTSEPTIDPSEVEIEVDIS